jgi:ribosomal protein S18 acetylase RimI-like enzyme
MKYLKLYELFNQLEVKLCNKSKESYDFISEYLDLITFEDYISNNNLHQVGVYYSGKLVALRIFRIRDGKMHLNYSAVDPEYRNRGINQLMFNKIIEVAKSHNITIITSNVRESNAKSLKSLLGSGFQINDEVYLYYPDGEKKIPLFYKL